MPFRRLWKAMTGDEQVDKGEANSVKTFLVDGLHRNQDDCKVTCVKGLVLRNLLMGQEKITMIILTPFYCVPAMCSKTRTSRILSLVFIRP